MKIHCYSNINKKDDTLRPYQEKAKREIFEAWDEVDSVMFQMPTGTGKTRLFTSIIRDINDYSLKRREPVKILIIAHRTELIDQIDKSLTKYHVAHNVISGGRKKEIKYPVHVASIQTLTNKNNLENAKKLNVQFVIIDEAHHALATTYKKLWKLYPEAKRLGVTATPWRMNHQSFTDLFDKLILSMPVKEFIKQGYLAPYKYFSLKNDSDIQKTIDDIELDKFGEYKESSMEEKMDIGSIRAQLLDSYLSLADGKKGIIYAINIEHAKHICEEYKKAGYNAVSIDSKTPAAKREELVNAFRRGLIDIIVNVDIFSEGFDCPDIEFIQLARPTRSLVKYLQQVGRGLRITENKQNCIILDNVGMYSRFGLPNARRHWKQHFLGKEVVEEPKRSFSLGKGGNRIVDMSEGTEDMELIQEVESDDANDIVGVEDNVVTKGVDDNDPMPILRSNNYKDDNAVFWLDNNKHIYESYIQDEKYYIISELLIDKTKHKVHRKRVGKIPMSSWMFWQMEREKVDNLKSIVHYSDIYTVFHYQVLGVEGKTKDKFFDYKGREIVSPNVVLEKYESAKKEREVKDFIDVPVSKAIFTANLYSNYITINRTLKGVTKPIAKFSVFSDFGKHYFYNSPAINQLKKDLGLNKIGSHNSDKYLIYRSDEQSFTVRCQVEDTIFLFTYDLNGGMIRKSTLARNNCSKGADTSLLADKDINKIWHVFDSKATSYKYFWFLSIMQLYEEDKQTTILFKDIEIRMISNAWKYCFTENATFSQIDQIPMYVSSILVKCSLNKSADDLFVENRVHRYYERLNIGQLLSPLLKNVPYRFLSPWIPFISNEDVIAKSNENNAKCLYSLHNDHIELNTIWCDYLRENHNKIVSFIEEELRTYLKCRITQDATGTGTLSQ